MRIVWLTGDYINRRQRQLQAKKEGCDLVLSFHFNYASNPKARGSEFYCNNRCSSGVKRIALNTCAYIVTKFGIPFRGEKVVTSRQAFINHYLCPTILFEFLFISNEEDAKILHRTAFIESVARVLAANVYEWLLANVGQRAVIGIDAGHNFKSKEDTGAYCVGAKGCNEAKHTLAMGQAFERAIITLARNRGETNGVG